MKKIIFILGLTILYSCNKNDFNWEKYPNKIPCICNSQSPDYYISYVGVSGIFDNQSEANPLSKLYQKNNIKLSINSDYELKIKTNSSGYLYVYFDWNKNYTFDKNELIANLNTKTDSLVKIIFSVPKNTISGRSYFRVLYRIKEDSDPCNSILYGEVEDYLMYIE